MAFPLDESHSAVTGFGDVQAEVEAAISGAEGKPAKIVSLGLIFGT